MLIGKDQWREGTQEPFELASTLQVTLSLIAHSSSLLAYFLWSSHAAILQGSKHSILLLSLHSLLGRSYWILSTLQGFKCLLHMRSLSPT